MVPHQWAGSLGGRLKCLTNSSWDWSRQGKLPPRSLEQQSWSSQVASTGILLTRVGRTTYLAPSFTGPWDT